MQKVIQSLRHALPTPFRQVLRSAVGRLRKQRFKPYLIHKSLEGVDFDFWIADVNGRNWYDNTDPVWLEMRFVRDNLIAPGDVCLECGGHHGCTAILLSRWVGAEGKVITFEAMPDNQDVLERNVQQNHIRNVVLERKAVGAENGTVEFPSGRNTMIKVDLINLDEFAHLMPTFLKIDVEGFEGQVLRGASKILARRPKIALEIHSPETLAMHGTSVAELFALIGVDDYHLWVQWNDENPPQKYDMRTPINQRVHLYCIPKVAGSQFA